MGAAWTSAERSLFQLEGIFTERTASHTSEQYEQPGEETDPPSFIHGWNLSVVFAPIYQAIEHYKKTVMFIPCLAINNGEGDPILCLQAWKLMLMKPLKLTKARPAYKYYIV